MDHAAHETGLWVKPMTQVISAKLDAEPFRSAIVVARFNEFITSRLVSGALDELVRHGAEPENLVQVWVPGSWEIPLAAQKLATSGRYAAVICLGCVIRGQTPHFEYVASEVAKGIAHVSLSTGIPVTFGVVTADSLEQAIDRAGAKTGNKGADSARAALEMANLLTELGR
jgi:6,7-dimethyl-8-ribityllumazine synthase